MRMKGSKWVRAIGERSRPTASHHSDTQPKRDGDAKDRDTEIDDVVIKRQCQQVERNVSTEYRIDHAGRRGAKEPHERNPERGREESHEAGKTNSDDPRRSFRDHRIGPAQYAQVGADKQADQQQDREENCHAVFKRQPIAMALAQLAKPIDFQRDAERRFKDDDAEDGNQNVGGIAIEPAHERNVVAARSLSEGANQGQRRPQENKQVEDPEHRSFLHLGGSRTFGRHSKAAVTYYFALLRTAVLCLKYKEQYSAKCFGVV